jgi:hypothetical protein
MFRRKRIKKNLGYLIEGGCVKKMLVKGIAWISLLFTFSTTLGLLLYYGFVENIRWVGVLAGFVFVSIPSFLLSSKIMSILTTSNNETKP